MKIGKATNSHGYVLADPESFHARSPLDDTESGHAWTNLTRRVAAGLGASWFSEYRTEPFTKWVQESLGFSTEGTELLLEEFSGLDLGEHEVIPEILRSPDVYGKTISLHESVLAQSIVDILSNLNVSGEEVSIIGVGGWLIQGDTPFVWMGSWGTSFGTRCHVWFEIRRDSTGVERAIFFSNLLVSTRAINDTRARELTESVVLGRWCQTLLYLSETPFPSSIMSFTRDLAMESLPVGLRPQPLAWVEDFAITGSPNGDSSHGQVFMDFASYPLVLKLGYVIPSLPKNQLTAALSVAIDSLVHAASIVQDGFLNARSNDSPAPFDQVFMSEFEFHSGEVGAVDGYARWIPEPLIGSLGQRSTENYYLTTQADKSDPELLSALQWIANNGAGASVASAINTLAYSFLIPNRDYENAAFYLRTAIDLDVWNESTNAMVNYGAMLLESGERDDGERMLLAALERVDGLAEGEASLLLGRLYREEGDEVRARTYLERAAASEDLDFVALAKQELLAREPAPSSTGTGSPRVRFCSNCGNAFTTDQQNFCGECGQRREG